MAEAVKEKRELTQRDRVSIGYMVQTHSAYRDEVYLKALAEALKDEAERKGQGCLRRG